MDLKLLAKVGAKPEGKFFALPADMKALADADLVQGNPKLKNPRNGKQIAFRLTPKGKAELDKPSTSASAATETKVPTFAIVKITSIPKVVRGGGGGVSKYPFDQLEPGTGFFIPNSMTKAKKPAKAFGSTVSMQNAKYNTADDFRRFTVRSLEDGREFGKQYEGVAGIGVYRQFAEDEAAALAQAKKDKTLTK